ncbi:hypothetical protein AAKU67_002220 [Oxalobacteraceae bacterium GrIS 2.11]
MGISAGAFLEYVAGSAAVDAGTTAAVAGAGELTASDLALTAGVEGATAATASTAGATAAEIAAAQGVGGTAEGLTAAAAGGGVAAGAAGGSALTGSQALTGAQTALSGVNLAKTLLAPTPHIAAPSAPPPTPQAAQAPNSNMISASLGGGLGASTPGVAQTLLTGGGGVDPSTLNLGKNTLLGS